MPPKKNAVSQPPLPVIRVAPLGVMHVFQISEAELEKLEAGPPGQLHLNFALAMLPTALSIFISLQTAQFTLEWRIGYQIAVWMLGVQGAISLTRWYRESGEFKAIIQEIRARMPDQPGIPEQLPLPGQVKVTSIEADEAS